MLEDDAEIVEFYAHEYNHIAEVLGLVHEIVMLRDGREDKIIQDFITSLEAGDTFVLAKTERVQDEA